MNTSKTRTTHNLNTNRNPTKKQNANIIKQNTNEGKQNTIKTTIGTHIEHERNPNITRTRHKQYTRNTNTTYKQHQTTL